jgi:two-component system phosphate regulon sensor histidine kinase PhoR
MLVNRINSRIARTAIINKKVTFIGSIVSMKFFFQNRRSNDRDHEPQSMTSGKADFIRNITHDIKGDFFGVSSMCLILKLAIEKKEDPITILDRLTEACDEYKYRLNNFLEYTKFDAGMRDTLREPVNLQSLLAATIAQAQPRALPKAIKIDLNIAGHLPATITSDEFRLKHITENILVNAINFSAPGSHIAVKAEKRGDCWMLTVSDHGIGMTREQLDSLFKLTPAERRSLKNPTGLGLLVTRYLVEDVLQGKLSFTSEPGKGTRAEIELPLIEAA